MSHLVAKSAYKSLEERINRFPQGAPPSETLYKILGTLFTEKEAQLVAQLPIKPFTVKQAAFIWKLSEVECKNILDNLASKALLLDVDNNGIQQYILPPPMAGFFEFALMRVGTHLDQKIISELFHQYLHVEEDFVKDLFWGSETKMGRAFVQEGVLSSENALHILDFERASHIIESAGTIGVSTCYCRHKNHHLGTACDAPMETCLTFGDTASSLIKHGYARSIDASEGIDILHMCYEHNLVQCGENVKLDPSFMCNCCGCCCEAMVAGKKLGMLHPVETTGFIPRINRDTCVNCGKCSKVCPINAMEMVKDENGKLKPMVNEEVCLGCGVCVRVCGRKSLFLERRKNEILTPVNTVHRLVLQAIEKGTLQHLIFDNQALGSHRAMAAILGAILKLPPLKQAMASKQMKSVYLEKLLSGSKV